VSVTTSAALPLTAGATEPTAALAMSVGVGFGFKVFYGDVCLRE